MKLGSLVAVAAAAFTTVALSSLLASPSEGKTYLKYTNLICSVNWNNPSFPVVVFNMNPANSMNYPNAIPKGTKIYWNSGTHKGNDVLSSDLPPGGAFVTTGTLPSFALCHASFAVCTKPPEGPNQKFC